MVLGAAEEATYSLGTVCQQSLKRKLTVHLFGVLSVSAIVEILNNFTRLFSSQYLVKTRGKVWLVPVCRWKCHLHWWFINRSRYWTNDAETSCAETVQTTTPPVHCLNSWSRSHLMFTPETWSFIFDWEFQAKHFASLCCTFPDTSFAFLNLTEENVRLKSVLEKFNSLSIPESAPTTEVRPPNLMHFNHNCVLQLLPLPVMKQKTKRRGLESAGAASLTRVETSKQVVSLSTKPRRKQALILHSENVVFQMWWATASMASLENALKIKFGKLVWSDSPKRTYHNVKSANQSKVRFQAMLLSGLATYELGVNLELSFHSKTPFKCKTVSQSQPQIPKQAQKTDLFTILSPVHIPGCINLENVCRVMLQHNY